MLDIEKYQTEIVALCHELRIKRLDLFGSATGEDFGPQSDVDVLVAFERYEGGNLFDRYFTLKEKLTAFFSREVDVVMENAIKNPYFRDSIEKTRKTIYAA